MPVNVPDYVQILSGSGVVMDPAHVLTGANVTNVNNGAVYVSVPSEIIRGQRIGTWITSHHGTRGTINARVTVGADGSDRMLGLLSVSRSDLDFSVQLTLDASNRLEAQIQSYGVVVAEYTGGGSAIAEGTPIEATLKWDADTAAFGGLHAEILLNGGDAGGSWATSPNSSWVASVMGNFQVGWAPATWSDFNGIFNVVQLGDQY